MKCWEFPAELRNSLASQEKLPAGVYSRNKFEKLVHLVGFVIRIYRDERSPERQNSQYQTDSFLFWK